MRSEYVLTECVNRGAAVLTGYMPGWENHIDTATLDIHSLDVCILGQLFETHYGASLAILAEFEGIPERDFRGPLYGFDAFSQQLSKEYEEECARLTELWRDKIKELKNDHLMANMGA